MGSWETHLKFLSSFVPPSDFVSETSDVAQESLETSSSAGQLSSNQKHCQCSRASKLWRGAKKIREGGGKYRQIDRNTPSFLAVRFKNSHTTPLSTFLNAVHSPPLKETPNGCLSYTGHLY